jgi:prepilin-type N-terminal cleavage/methylation domain-containing protein
MCRGAKAPHAFSLTINGDIMKKNVRRGFTLPEILVTVTVIAVLAAVVVPTVLQYVNKGDAPSALSEIDAIKKGMIGFTADTRHYPRTLQQLTTAISSTADCTVGANCDLNSAAYGVGDVPLWKGPYFEGVPGASTYSTKTLGLVFSDTLAKCGTSICLKVLGTYTPEALDALDMKIDGGIGTEATDAASGNLIWSISSTPSGIFIKLGVAN